MKGRIHIDKIVLLLVLVSSLLFFSCKEHNESVIEWKVRLEQNSEGTYQLLNSFKSTSEISMLFDKEAFCYTCTYGENVKLSDKNLPTPDIFKNSQIVIENNKGMKRLYSNMYTLQGESKIIMTDMCMFGCHKHLKLGKKTQYVVVEIPYLSDLQVTDRDKRIRLIYLFKASDQQKNNGYSDLRLISEWFTLH